MVIQAAKEMRSASISRKVAKIAKKEGQIFYKLTWRLGAFA
jgi:hypothetical protein